VRVAHARHQAEAELVQNLLLEEGVPSLTRRAGGFDVPDFLAAGPRDIFVPSSGADAARDILGSDQRAPSRLPPQRPAWVRALAVVLLVVIAASVAGALIV
jgi:hypothetical protein